MIDISQTEYIATTPKERATIIKQLPRQITPFISYASSTCICALLFRDSKFTLTESELLFELLVSASFFYSIFSTLRLFFRNCKQANERLSNCDYVTPAQEVGTIQTYDMLRNQVLVEFEDGYKQFYPLQPEHDIADSHAKLRVNVFITHGLLISTSLLSFMLLNLHFALLHILIYSVNLCVFAIIFKRMKFISNERNLHLLKNLSQLRWITSDGRSGIVRWVERKYSWDNETYTDLMTLKIEGGDIEIFDRATLQPYRNYWFF